MFQDRYKSATVDDEEYFLTVLRFIHQNPVMAGFCREASDYKWGIYNDYFTDSGITDTEFALKMFTADKKK